MKVGDYVRTKNGEIGKIVNVEVYYVLGQNDKNKFSCVLFNNSYVPCIVLNNFIIKKGQLIDLIEVGDYVNGVLVESIYQREKDKLYIHSFDTEIMMCFTNNNINSIVTKEMYSSVEYRVENN